MKLDKSKPWIRQALLMQAALPMVPLPVLIKRAKKRYMKKHAAQAGVPLDLSKKKDLLIGAAVGYGIAKLLKL